MLKPFVHSPLLTIIFLFITLNIIPGCYVVRSVDSDPNEFEWAYDSIANNLEMAEFCYKISPYPYTSGGLLFRMSYLRSECFYDVARQTSNIELCKHVTTMSPIYFLNEEHMSKSECKSDINNSYKPNISKHGINYELIVRLLGYYDSNEEPIIEVFADDKIYPGNKVRKELLRKQVFEEIYDSNIDKPEFRSKLLSLPDFSSSDEKAMEQIRKLAPQCTLDNEVNLLCKLIKRGLCRNFQGCDSPMPIRAN